MGRQTLILASRNLERGPRGSIRNAAWKATSQGKHRSNAGETVLKKRKSHLHCPSASKTGLKKRKNHLAPTGKFMEKQQLHMRKGALPLVKPGYINSGKQMKEVIHSWETCRDTRGMTGKGRPLGLWVRLKKALVGFLVPQFLVHMPTADGREVF